MGEDGQRAQDDRQFNQQFQDNRLILIRQPDGSRESPDAQLCAFA
jgi:hypothetical protein